MPLHVHVVCHAKQKRQLLHCLLSFAVYRTVYEHNYLLCTCSYICTENFLVSTNGSLSVVILMDLSGFWKIYPLSSDHTVFSPASLTFSARGSTLESDISASQILHSRSPHWKSKHIYDGRVDHKQKYSNKAEKN